MYFYIVHYTFISFTMLLEIQYYSKNKLKDLKHKRGSVYVSESHSIWNDSFDFSLNLNII